MKQTALVFGGTGFIGSHVVEALKQVGHDVRCVVRRGANVQFLDELSVSVKELESFDPESLHAVMEGCSVIYNCTADVRLNRSLDEYRQTQADLTRKLATAASAHKGVRFVQLSTIEVYGDTPNQLIDEDYPCNPLFEFQQSVLERELALRKIAEETGLEYVIARPAATFGRRYRFMKFMLEAHQKGRFPLIGDGRVSMSMVDTRDIAGAMVLLGNHPQAANQVFHISGYEASMRDLKNEIDRTSGRTSKAQILPVPVAKVLARILELVTPKSKVPFISRFAVHAISRPKFFNTDKISSLGFVPRYQLTDTVKNILSHVEEDHGLNREQLSSREATSREALV